MTPYERRLRKRWQKGKPATLDPECYTTPEGMLRVTVQHDRGEGMTICFDPAGVPDMFEDMNNDPNMPEVLKKVDLDKPEHFGSVMRLVDIGLAGDAHERHSAVVLALWAYWHRSDLKIPESLRRVLDEHKRACLTVFIHKNTGHAVAVVSPEYVPDLDLLPLAVTPSQGTA